MSFILAAAVEELRSIAVDEATRSGCKLRGGCPFQAALSRCTFFVTPDFSTHTN